MTLDCDGDLCDFLYWEQFCRFRKSDLTLTIYFTYSSKTSPSLGVLLMHCLTSHSFRCDLTLFESELRLGAVTIPGIVKEGIDFVNRLQNENIWIVVLEKMRNGLG